MKRCSLRRGSCLLFMGSQFLSVELIQIENAALRWPESIYKFTEANVFTGI